MEKVSDLIKIRLNQHHLGSSAQASEVVFKANQYLKGWLSATSQEVRVTLLKNTVLWVEVAHPTWAEEVRAVSSVLLKRLKMDYGEKIVGKVCTKSLTTK